MRSIMIFAVLAAVVGFTGCHGTGGSRLLGHGCKLGNIGKRAAQAGSVGSCCDQGGYVEAGGCGCGGEIYSDQGMMEYAPADGGCGCGGSVSAPSDCGCGGESYGGEIYGGAPVVMPMQFSAPTGGSGCSACDGASIQAPGKLRSRMASKQIGNGMGLTMKDRGIACNAKGPERRATRKAARSLKPNLTKTSLKEKFGFGATEQSYEGYQEYDLVSDEYVTECEGCSSGVAGRRISRGVISDFREVRGHLAGGGAVAAAHGCGRGGCGHSGRLCGACSKLRGLAALGAGNPYGGAIPHTAQQPGQSGMAPSYAYPYYTTRGPRDFLRDNPPSIGR